MTGGWLVGQIVGRVQIPSHPYHEPVRVYDRISSTWVKFPDLLLYSPPSFVRNYEWLPAILESHLLAVAHFGVGELRGASMRPYQTLRSLWDSSEDRPANVAGGMDTLGASQVIRDWLTTGEVPESGMSRCEAVSRPQRRERAEGFLANIASVARAEAEPVTTADRRREAAVFRDLAQDVLAVIPVIQMMLETEPETRQFAEDGF